MADIEVSRPEEAEIEKQGIRGWPIWEKEVSSFPWSYDQKETCLLLEGRVKVTPDGGGEPVEFGPGDLVVFAQGLSCTWEISEPVRKHYRFG
jgi:uncharacterized cupin superfamily protein